MIAALEPIGSETTQPTTALCLRGDDISRVALLSVAALHRSSEVGLRWFAAAAAWDTGFLVVPHSVVPRQLEQPFID